MRDLAFVVALIVFAACIFIARRNRGADFRPVITGIGAGAAVVGAADLFTSADSLVAYVLLLSGLATFVFGVIDLRRSRPEGRWWFIAPIVLFLTLSMIAVAQFFI